MTSWPAVPRVLSKWPKAPDLSCGNAFAGPHQGLQDLSAREDGEKNKIKQTNKKLDKVAEGE